jgi:hypothetical protein
VNTFKATLAEPLETIRIEQAEPAALPLEVWAMDESRFGLQTVRRRRLTLAGIKPLGRYQHAFENVYVYGAVAPRLGEGYFEAHIALNGQQCQAYLDGLAAAHPTTFTVLIVDNARAHRFADLTLPTNVALIFQPPYAPELNPAERVWLAVKDNLAWRCFDDLLALQDALAHRIEELDPAALRSLTAYPYLMHAIHALAA